MTLYDPLRTRTVAGTPNGKAHACDMAGDPLCGAPVACGGQETLDRTPTCGWCRLLMATPPRVPTPEGHEDECF